MLLVILVCSLSLATTGQEADNDWIDPYDMLNYDPSTKTTRNSAEPAEYANVKIREFTQDSNEVYEWILVDLRPHDYEAWKWHFEDTFGVELDTLLKMGLGVLIIVAIICTQLWSTMSWLMQFRRLFGVSFFVSIIWNWLYLYKIAFADHQSNIAKMDSLSEKCTGVKKIDWSDSLKEWYRSTLTLQDDPCKEYYEAILINPILLVPPTKAIIYTITTCITEPLKQLGQGISEFLVALLKDLPITLQIPVLLTIVFAIVVCMYGGVQAAFQHGIAAPFRRLRGDPPPPQLEQPQPGGDAPQQVVEGRLHRNQVPQWLYNRQGWTGHQGYRGKHGIAAPFRRLRGDPPPPQLEQPQPGGDAPQQVVEGRLHRNQVPQWLYNRQGWTGHQGYRGNPR
ncbi:chloride channel CLIC-like protein 1 [Lycodopsis pacificus]